MAIKATCTYIVHYSAARLGMCVQLKRIHLVILMRTAKVPSSDFETMVYAKTLPSDVLSVLEMPPQTTASFNSPSVLRMPSFLQN